MSDDRAAALREARALYGPDDPRTRAAFTARLDELLAAEQHQHALYVISFADDAGHLGTAIVEADSPMTALTSTHLMGINPGGEAATYGPIPLDAIDRSYWGRLLQRDEVEAIPAP